MKETVLRTENLSCGYGEKSVLEGVTLEVRRGEIVTLIGPNGAGKSTLLKTLSRQLERVAGTVFLGEEELKALSPSQLSKRLSVLLTERVNPERMTCAEVVSTGRYPYTGRLGILSPRDWEKVEEALSLMHISELSQRPFAQLSDGQRQRVMVARALCQEPEVLILDEPTSYLDIRYKLELLELVNTLAREKNLAIVLSLHELELAEKISDALVCIHAGRAERIGTPEELFAGDYLPRLYGIDPALWLSLSQAPELSPCLGEPQVFVLGGGGKGISVYRKLRRMGIPFAAGVIAENDLDYPTARALAAQLVTVQPFESAGGAELERCAALLERCGVLISCPERFGAMNEACRGLLELEGVRILSAADFLAGRQSL